jgi:adenine deaminase
VLRAASLHPVDHYGLDVGLLRVGDAADFITMDELESFVPTATYINGMCVAKDGKSLIQRVPVDVMNHFSCTKKKEQDFQIKAQGTTLKVIEALEGELITKTFLTTAKTDINGNLITDVKQDILKIAVVNRYENSPPAVAFIKNFGLKKGAIASSVAHDSHNVVVVGVDDASITLAANAVIDSRGGLSAVVDGEVQLLPLPVAGLMSPEDGWKVATAYEELGHFVQKRLQSKLSSPFMTLSFMALLVIPELKLSDKGLFDGKQFAFTPLSI